MCAKKQMVKFMCNECGAESLQWLGRCPLCGEWNTMEEIKASKSEYPASVLLSTGTKVKKAVKLSDIDKCARKVISDEGYGKYFTHRLGHFIGRDVHEYGDVSSVNEMEVEEGMIFSIEPGIYLEGNFGVRVEDLVMVTKDGCQVLNSFTKDIYII